MTCRDCRYLEVPKAPSKDHRVYDCLVEIPAPKYPTCISERNRLPWPPPREWMRPVDGEGCPYFDAKPS